MCLYKEGIQLAMGASGIYERLGDTVKQAWCSNILARLLYQNKQLDAAEEAATLAVELLSEKGEQYLVCGSHRVLGHIYHSKGQREKVVNHFEVVLRVASSFDWQDELFWTHYELAHLFLNEGRFNDAHDHVERAKVHAVNDTYKLGRAMELQARSYYKQHRLEGARSEASRAADFFGKLGAAHNLEMCRKLLQQIEEEMNKPITSSQLDFNCEFL